MVSSTRQFHSRIHKRQIFIEIGVWHAYTARYRSRATNFSHFLSLARTAHSLVQTLNLFMGCVSCCTNEPKLKFIRMALANAFRSCSCCSEKWNSRASCSIKIQRRRITETWNGRNKRKRVVSRLEIFVVSERRFSRWFLSTNCVRNACTFVRDWRQASAVCSTVNQWFDTKLIKLKLNWRMWGNARWLIAITPPKMNSTHTRARSRQQTTRHININLLHFPCVDYR